MPMPTPTEQCPRCDCTTLHSRQVLNALSRTTRGMYDPPVYVCSDCGTDEALEEYFLHSASPVTTWPLPGWSFANLIEDTNKRIDEVRLINDMPAQGKEETP
mgnify:CR=1 FL=1|jgi:hypothetical protein